MSTTAVSTTTGPTAIGSTPADSTTVATTTVASTSGHLADEPKYSRLAEAVRAYRLRSRARRMHAEYERALHAAPQSVREDLMALHARQF